MEPRVVFCIEHLHELDTGFHQVRDLASRRSSSDGNREPSEETINLWLLPLLYMVSNLLNTTLTASRQKTQMTQMCMLNTNRGAGNQLQGAHCLEVRMGFQIDMVTQVSWEGSVSPLTCVQCHQWRAVHPVPDTLASLSRNKLDNNSTTCLAELMRLAEKD